jgi:presenilin-like A22 family membrane protease
MTEERKRESRGPMLVMMIFVAAVQVLSMAVMPTLMASDARAFENPESAANPIIYIFLVLGFTLLLLMAMRLKKGWLVKGFILLSVAMSIFYILFALTPLAVALALTGAALLLLKFYPEWYIIDALGILICAGISALFGISMTTLPALILLSVLAVYDAISVYKTRHMVSLAEGVIDLKAPLLFVVPREKGYSFLKEQAPGKGLGKGAFFLGLGDAIIPTVLAVSANWSLQAGGAWGVNIPAWGAVLGTYLGFLLLFTTSRDKPQAGLPFLNGGAILGFLLACAASGVRPF